MSERKAFLTLQGLEHIKAELEWIEQQRMPRLRAEIARTNGAQDDGKLTMHREQLQFYKQRVPILKDMIENATIIGTGDVEKPAISSLDEKVEDEWRNFWARIVLNADGTPNMEQIKKELYDYHLLWDSVPKVYDHITGGMISKPFADPKVVCQEADEHYRRVFEDELADAIGKVIEHA